MSQINASCTKINLKTLTESKYSVRTIDTDLWADVGYAYIWRKSHLLAKIFHIMSANTPSKSVYHLCGSWTMNNRIELWAVAPCSNDLPIWCFRTSLSKLGLPLRLRLMDLRFSSARKTATIWIPTTISRNPTTMSLFVRALLLWSDKVAWNCCWGSTFLLFCVLNIFTRIFVVCESAISPFVCRKCVVIPPIYEHYVRNDDDLLHWSSWIDQIDLPTRVHLMSRRY